MKKYASSYFNSLLCVCLFVTASACFAELTVVGDLGGASTRPFFDAINADAVSPLPDVSSLPEPPVSLSVSNMLPVSTPEMTPGKVMPRALHLPGLFPFFVVGDDDFSRQWLQQNAADLYHLHAIGMIVNVRDESRLNILRRLVPGVGMMPVSGDELSHRLALMHYPALISATGISQ